MKKKWHNENKDTISIFDRYLYSDELQNKSMKKKYSRSTENILRLTITTMVAIPLIRQFSKSYDHYYKKLTEAEVTIIIKAKGDDPQ